MIETSFSFIEAPIHQGQSHFGVVLGPGFIRQCLLDQNFHFKNFNVMSKQSRHEIQWQAYEALSQIVEQEARRKQPLFIAGGDHSLSIGSIQGLMRVEPDLKVVWVDAHGDINTRISSLSGALHGMPLAYLIGEDTVSGSRWFTEKLKPENLIYFGVRDLDTAEKLFLDALNIRYYTTSDIERLGLPEVIWQICKLTAGSKIHLSVDSDAFDPAIAPSTGIRVEYGLSIESVHALTKALISSGRIISYEFVELNPQIFSSLSDVNKTAQIGIDLLKLILNENKLISNFTKKEKYDGNYSKYIPTKPDFYNENLQEFGLPRP